MPSKRKAADIMNFDANKSDSNDDDFEPGSDRPPRVSKKARKSAGGPKSSSKSGKRKARYRGSDIEDDEDELDSDDEVSEAEESEETDRDETTGRPRRQAKTNHTKYEELSSEESQNDSDSEVERRKRGVVRGKRGAGSGKGPERAETPPKQKLIIKLPVSMRTTRASSRTQTAAAPSTSRASRAASTRQRSTRSHSVDPLYEGLPSTTRSRRQKNPIEIDDEDEDDEGQVADSARKSRGMKGLQVASTIKEEPHETSSYEQATQGDDTMADEIAGTDDQNEHIAQSPDPVVADFQQADARIEEDTPHEPAVNSIENDDGDDESEEDPVARRRPVRDRQANEHEPSAEAQIAGDVEDTGSRRKTRRKTGKKKDTEDEEDFNPEDNVSDDEMSASDTAKKRVAARSEDEESSQGSKRRGRRSAKRSQRNSQLRDDDSASDEIDPDEVADELGELKPSRKRKAQQLEQDGIEYATNKRTRGNRVSYKLSTMQEVLAADEAAMAEQAESETSRRPAVRKGAGRGNSGWDRSLYTTFGPFGGSVTANAAPIFGGPWGTGAAGGVESDSSDDEGMQRPHNIGGNVGMTPTSAFPPGLLPGMGQTNNAEGVGGPNVGKVKSQKSLADADPLGVDQNVDFSKIGGLDGHIDQLKEMVMMPLLYPELFQKFKVVPPRGVLFHGPPGTGKTLLARALAASVGSSGRKVTFYMRKGADALSKWVGEAERQLRLLFEEARKTQPSIIFFDEIDGLAPVRSSKQEQIHASIVSTLLALMDGMDGRGQVIVIGATNRPDNIDPALRRPGRFDREFYFPLPGLEARKSIIDINTKEWEIDDKFKLQLAELTKGYGGADLRSLCTEAALNSIQRTYPQIYSSNDKLLIDATKIKVNAKDFMLSIKKIIPSSERSTSSGAAPVPKVVEPLLRSQLDQIKKILDGLIPSKKKATALEEAMYEQYDDEDLGFAREQMQQDFERSRVFRPRLLICGEPGMGQQYLGGAILNHFEGLHVQSFDLPTIYSDSARAAETAIVQLFAEVKRHKPSVIYIPAVDIWYQTLPPNVITTFLGLLKSIPPNDPVMVLGITDTPAAKLNPTLLRDLFGFSKYNQFAIQRPTKANREEFFLPILSYARKCPKDFPDPTNRKKRKLEQLPLAPIPPPVPPSREEMKALETRDLLVLNTLKITIQPIMDQIKKKYAFLRSSIIPDESIAHLYLEQDPDYIRPDIEGAEPRAFELAKDSKDRDCILETATGKLYYNMNIVMIEERLANGFYARPQDFLSDIQTLKADYYTAGTQERYMKQTNELVSNVMVDILPMTALPQFADCENVYQRQSQRAKQREEKYQKLLKVQSEAAAATAVVEEDAFQEIGTDIPNLLNPAPVLVGAPPTGIRDLYATPRPSTGSLSNGHVADQSNSNGTSVPTRSDESQFSSAGNNNAVHGSPMHPPQRTSTSGVNTQISQRSAWQELSHGTSPSQLINDASTTDSGNKTSDRWSTQATNGVSNHNSSPLDKPIQAQASSQGNTQGTSSEEWAHSQAHALKRGDLHNSNPSQGTSSGSQFSQPLATPIYSAPPRLNGPSHPSGFANLLNDVPQAEPTSSQLSSQKDQIVDETFITDLHHRLVDGSSGCSVEQLEQVYRELMDTLWSQRGEWNRSLVTAKLVRVFNSTIHDIEDIQKVLAASQPADNDYPMSGHA